MATEDALAKLTLQLEKMCSTNDMIVNRLETLEKGRAHVAPVIKQGDRSDEGTGSAGLRMQTAAKEKSLTLTFGDSGDTSPNSLRLFLDHYELAEAQNRERRVEGWESPAFRARELRLQLRGETALWLSHESAMAQVWICDDGEIIARLKKRYLGTQSIELNILMFEELSQNEGEDLAAYMTRCQQKGLEAFQGLGEPISTQQRIIWKFLSGIKDQAIRSEVIRQRWMKSPTGPKGYDEVLLIAEQAKLDKLATTATGNGSGFGKKGSFQAAPVSKVSERRKAGNYKARTPHTSGESSVRSTLAPFLPGDRLDHPVTQTGEEALMVTFCAISVKRLATLGAGKHALSGHKRSPPGNRARVFRTALNRSGTRVGGQGGGDCSRGQTVDLC